MNNNKELTMPLITIIVPIYNVEKYLKACIDSVLNQTYHNLEVILVDDGSPDKCPEICDEYAKKDYRIIVIHKKNGGLSSARNAGLKICKGEYISFVDSDDIIAPSMMENLLNISTSRNVLANTRMKLLSEDGTKKTYLIDDYKEKSSVDYLRSLLMHRGDSSVCTKLFRKSQIDGMLFDETILNEDVLFMISLLDKFDRIVYTASEDYCYISHNASTSRSFGKAIHDMVENASRIRRYINKFYPQLNEEAERFEIFQNIAFLCACPLKYERKKDDVYKRAVSYLRHNFIKGLRNHCLTSKDKFKLIMLVISPRLTSVLLSLK